MDLYWYERKYFAQGYRAIAGVDEVGRGCLAGPVFAAAVILPKELVLPKLNDSKKLTPSLREKLNEQILRGAVSVNVARVSVQEIDQINIFHASLKAMKLALQGLKPIPDMVLVDGKFPLPIPTPQDPLVQGDGRAASIAAASIVAKVARDQFMVDREKEFPGFSFAKHKGYGTRQHLEELKANGPTILHRRSFAPVRDCRTHVLEKY